MPSPHDIRPGVRRLFRLALRRRGAAAGAEMDDEIRLHLALRTEQLVRQGLGPDAARAEAERRFGSLDEARARLHHSARRREDRMRMREWLDAVRHDARLALRGMRRTPGFVVTVVLCLALGIGGNAAAFSLFDALLLRPVPAVREPERLVNLGSPGPRTGPDNWNQAGSSEVLFSHPMFRDLERARPGLASVAAHRLFFANFTYGDRTEFGLGVLVSGSYFSTLGLRPALGRLLGPADDQTPGAHPLAVLSHAYWTSALGADPGVVGRTVVVNGRSLTVVGVAPRGFEGTTLGAEPRVFVPLVMASELDSGFGSHAGFADRRWYWLYVFGRLRPGVSLDRARVELDAFYKPILAEVEAPLQEGMSARTMARFRARTITVEDGRRGQSLLHAQTRAPLTLLFGITALVALIACANVANLLLARGAARSTEIAVRLSLGAGRSRLVAQLLTESLLLAALGGAASLAVARATVWGMRALVPPVELGADARLPIELRPSAFLFAAAVALGTGVLFGLFPALQSTRPDIVTAIRAGGGQPGGARAAARFRTTLVTAQIALSMALLVAAGLFVQSLRNVSRVRLGLDVDRVALFALAPIFNGYEPAKSRALFARVEEELAATPGVTSVAASAVSLLSGSTRGGDVRAEGFATGPDVDANARLNLIGPGYFRTLGVPLLAGRELTAADRLGAPKVAVVNEAFARKFGLGANPVGRRIGFEGVSKGGALDVEIVGLVRDSRYSGVKEAEPPTFFLPYRQDAEIGGLFFYVRTPLPPEALLRTIRGVVSRVDPTLPIVGLKTMSQQVRENVYLDRMIGTLSAAFAALATLLAAVGLYGVLAYSVSQRTREIGVRMALGADGRRVRGMVLLQVARMLLVGGAVGVAGALLLGRAASSMLYGLQGNDVTIMAAAAALLTLTAFAAGYLPASRASRVDPVVALRAE